MARWDALLDYIFPQICELCETTLVPARPVPLCPYCHAALPRQPEPLEVPAADSNSAIASLVAPLIYDNYAIRLVTQLKFAHNARAAKILAAEIAAAVAKSASADAWPGLLLPVPLSWRSQFHRGYNQAEWLAYYVGAQLAIPVDYASLRRKHRVSQRTLSKAQRLALPDNTFRLVRHMAVEHVTLIDDVYTTGATTRALANQLHRAGAQRIDVWCAARVQPGPF